MVATHTIALDFLGRAARAEYRGTLQDYGNLAVKLLRTHTMQLDALQRLRGKASEQKVTVEHVHVYKPWSGMLKPAGGGRGPKKKLGNNAVQSNVPMHQSPRCGARTPNGRPCRSPAVCGKRRCRMHGGTNSGAPLRNQNAFKHGHYATATALQRQLLRTLLRESRNLIGQIE